MAPDAPRPEHLPDMPVSYGEAVRKLCRVSRASGTMTPGQFTVCIVKLAERFQR